MCGSLMLQSLIKHYLIAASFDVPADPRRVPVDQEAQPDNSDRGSADHAQDKCDDVDHSVTSSSHTEIMSIESMSDS